MYETTAIPTTKNKIIVPADSPSSVPVEALAAANLLIPID